MTLKFVWHTMRHHSHSTEIRTEIQEIIYNANLKVEDEGEDSHDDGVDEEQMGAEDGGAQHVAQSAVHVTQTLVLLREPQESVVLLPGTSPSPLPAPTCVAWIFLS